ncbi:MAG: PDZ domain-containing protein, partial [Planctomycetota bacterium]
PTAVRAGRGARGRERVPVERRSEEETFLQKIRRGGRAAGTTLVDAEVTLDVWRGGKRLQVRARLKAAEETPPEEPRPSPAEGEGARQERRDSGLPGISVAPAPKDLLEEYGVAGEREGALVVTSVELPEASAFTGLRRGDLILEVGRTPVRTAEQMRRAVRASRGPVLLTVRRPGGTFFVAVPKPE